MSVYNGTTYNDKTPLELVNAIETARISGKRVRLFLGNQETGQVWHESYSVYGTIGRSTGTSKIPLMIANSRSSGGSGLLDDRILAVQYLDSMRFAYKHPLFEIPRYIMVTEDLPEGYTVGVNCDGERLANFRTEKQAARWVDFMTGKRRGL